MATSGRASYNPSSVPLPASNSVFKSPLEIAPTAPAPPSDVLDTVAGGFPAAAPGLAALPRTGVVGALVRLPSPRLPSAAHVPLPPSPPAYARPPAVRGTGPELRRRYVSESMEHPTQVAIRTPRVVVVVLREKCLFGRRIVERWERGWLRILG